MIDNRCCGRIKVVMAPRVAQAHAAAPATYFRMLAVWIATAFTFAEAEILSDHIVTRAQGK